MRPIPSHLSRHGGAIIPWTTRLPLDGTVVLFDACSMGGGSRSQLPMTVAGAPDVLEAFHQELKLAEAYGIHFDLSKCILHLLAGDGFRGDISGFQAVGVRVEVGPDVVDE